MGHRQTAVPVEQILVDESLDQTGTLGRHLAQESFGVQFAQDEADVAPRLVQLHFAPDPHHHAGVEHDAQLIEEGAHLAPAARPAHHLEHRGGRRSVGRVTQLDIAVTASAHLEGPHLPRHPELAGQRPTQRPVDPTVEVGDGESVRNQLIRAEARSGRSEGHGARLEGLCDEMVPIPPANTDRRR